MPLLLYCVTSSEESVNAAVGLAGAPVLWSDISGLRVVWSELKNPESELGTPEALKKSAVEFHRVLREMLATVTPIPFRFPTVLDSAEHLQQHITAEQEQYREMLARIGDAVQYDIVGTWPDDEQADFATPVSGREYLKRRQQSELRVSAVGQKLKSVTAGSVKEWRERQERKQHRWIALVPRECRSAFVSALRSAGASEGVKLRLSGPWPPAEFLTPRGDNV